MTGPLGGEMLTVAELSPVSGKQVHIKEKPKPGSPLGGEDHACATWWRLGAGNRVLDPTAPRLFVREGDKDVLHPRATEARRPAVCTPLTRSKGTVRAQYCS